MDAGRKMRLMLAGVIGGVAVLVVVVVAATCFSLRPPPNFLEEIKKTDDVKVSSWCFYRFSGERTVTVMITNTATLNYLTEVCRLAGEQHEPGQMASARVGLSDGQLLEVELSIADGGKSMAVFVRRGMFKDLEPFGVRFYEPIPAELVNALHQLITAK